MVFIESKIGIHVFFPSFPIAINVDKSKFWQEIYKDPVDQTKNGLSSIFLYTEYCSAQSLEMLLLLQILESFTNIH